MRHSTPGKPRHGFWHLSHPYVNGELWGTRQALYQTQTDR
jgi:hypothetical protein